MVGDSLLHARPVFGCRASVLAIFENVPKYTKMAIHRAIPVYSHFSILGHRAKL